MATKPRMVTNTSITSDVINAVRNSASRNYQDFVPYITPDADSLRGIGAIIMNNPALENEFINTLVNRIAFARIASRMYSNPLKTLKKGVIDTGETVEDIFVQIADVYQYRTIGGIDDGSTAEKLFKKYDSDVKTAFYIMNSQLTYPVTVNRAQLKTAFKSFAGMDELISALIQSVYSAAQYDEFVITKYLIGQQILKGRISYYTYTAGTGQYLSAATQLRKASNDFKFMSAAHNIAGVLTYTEDSKKTILINTDMDANIDTNVLSAAFNMPYVDYLNRRILIDGFGQLDVARLNVIFRDDPTYTEPSIDELAFLNKVGAVLIDEDFVQIYDNVFEMRDMPVANTLNHNYFLHMWQTYAVSPFANTTAVVPSDLVAAQTASNTTITPTATAISASLVGGKASGILSATVTTVSGAPQVVTWQMTSGSNAEVSGDGTWTATAAGIVKAKAVLNSNTAVESAEVTITIA